MLQTLHDTIEEIVKAQLSDAVVRSVEVAPDVDSDGDRIIRVEIVLRQDAAPATGKLLGLVRHLRTGLMAVHCDDFPIVSFVSESDVRKKTRAFA